MVLNNVTKFRRIIIKTIHVREQTSFQLMIFYKLRAITKLVLNNVTKFHKILIKTFRLRRWTSLKTVNFHKHGAITAESMVRYERLSNLEKTLWYLTM